MIDDKFWLFRWNIELMRMFHRNIRNWIERGGITGRGEDCEEKDNARSA